MNTSIAIQSPNLIPNLTDMAEDFHLKIEEFKSVSDVFAHTSHQTQTAEDTTEASVCICICCCCCAL